MQRSKFTIIWLVFALVPIVGMLLSPALWVRKAQVKEAILNESNTPPPSQQDFEEEAPAPTQEEVLDAHRLDAAAEESGDPKLRYASAILRTNTAYPPEPSLLSELAGLVRTDPSEFNYANWFRYTCSNFAPDNRARLDSAFLKEFLTRAEQSTKRYPENAFFEMMHVVALMNLNQKEETERLFRSETLPRYYYDGAGDEPKALIALRERAYGTLRAQKKILQSVTTLYPHYSPLRQVARMGGAYAQELEKLGKHWESILVRRCVMNWGSLMRDQSPNYMGTMIGHTLFAIGMNHTYVNGPPKPETSVAERQAAYKANLVGLDTYFRHQNSPALADWTKASLAEPKQFSMLLPDSDAAVDSNPRLLRLWLSWIRDNALLVCFGHIAFLWFCVSLTMRFPPKKKRAELLGLFLGVMLPMFSESPFAQLQQATQLGKYEDAATGQTLTLVSRWEYLYAGTLTLLPLMIVAGAFLFARARRLPLANGTMLNIRKAALPALALVLWVYWFSPTPALEATASKDLERMMKHEGKYRAELAGVKWAWTHTPPPAPGK